MRRPRKTPRRCAPEDVEQQHIRLLLGSIGAPFYEIGRPRARKCHACGAPSKDMGMRQTPGLPDIYAFLPLPRWVPDGHASALWIEMKAEDGRMSEEQETFRRLCFGRGVPHVNGTANAVAAYLVAGGWVREVAHYRMPSAAGDRR